MSTDIINTYIPPLSEIKDEAVISVRERLASLLIEKWPDLDTRPNSVFGDLFLTPASYMVAGLEEGMNRFMSDLDLENVANGVIWNCDFVSSYLGNFAIYNRTTLQSTGVLRIRFNADEEYFLDRRTKFGADGGVTNLFSLRMPNAGGWTLRKVGVPLGAYSNEAVLVDAGDGTYFADVPVVGTMDYQIVAGDSHTADPVSANVISITAIQDFNFGAPPESLAKLAEKTRQTIYSASMGSRGTARRFLEKEFPDLTAISPSLSGDAVMMRDSTNAFGVADGRMDVHVKSSYITDTQIVIGIYDSVADKFVVKLELAGTPVVIDSVTYGDSVSVPSDSFYIWSKTTDAVKASMASASYSKYEDLYLVVDRLVNDAGDDIIGTDHDTSGNRIAMFTVTYKQDPMVSVVDATVSSSDVSPVGVDVLVKGFTPIVFTRFNVKYTKRPGTTVGVGAAREEIFSYINGLGHPYLYSDAKIVDAMFYAGASDVREVDVVASVQWSIADGFLPSEGADPTDDLTTALTEVITPGTLGISSSSGLKPSFTDPNTGYPSQTLISIGPRNTTYVLDKTLIEFTEIEEE